MPLLETFTYPSSPLERSRRTVLGCTFRKAAAPATLIIVSSERSAVPFMTVLWAERLTCPRFRSGLRCVATTDHTRNGR